MALPREFHEQCRVSFELEYLKVSQLQLALIFFPDLDTASIRPLSSVCSFLFFTKLIWFTWVLFSPFWCISNVQMFYCWAQDAAVSVSNKIIESDSAIPEVKVCTAALRLMLQILNWDFKYDANMPDNAKRAIDVFSGGVRDDVSSSKRTECNLVQVIN